MKKLISIALVLLFCLTIVSAEAPIINAKSAILVNADSGQILFQHNADQPLPMASTTKIMTALIILENGDLNASITTSKDFANPGGSHIAIDHEETLSTKDLLYALLLESANDAAIALAEGHSGSSEAFVEQMNKTALELGATQTNFINPHGLDAEGHVTSAADLALIASRAMQNPVFREIVKTTSYTIAPTNKKEEARDYIKNRNLLLHDNNDEIDYNGQRIAIYDARVDGVKTGYTENAQNCLVTSFTNDASRYIIVVLGAESQSLLYGETKQLIDYAINDFSLQRIVTEGEVITNIKVKNAEASGLNLVAAKTIERAVPITEQSEIVVDKEITLDETERDSILMGSKMGEVSYSIDGEVIAKVDLLAQIDIDERDLVGELTHALSTRPTLQSPLEVLVLILKLLLTFAIWRFIIRRVRRHRAKLSRDQRRAELKRSNQNNVVPINRRSRK